MRAKTCKIIAVIAAIIAVIGLVSFVCGTRNVNVGSFIFPVIIAVWAFYGYRRKMRTDEERQE